MTFSLSSFILIKRLYSSSSLSAINVVSSAYLRLLMFLLVILIPACKSSDPAFHMMYSAQRLNKQGDNIQPCCTPFSVLNQSVVSYSLFHLFICIQFAYGQQTPACQRKPTIPVRLSERSEFRRNGPPIRAQ